MSRGTPLGSRLRVEVGPPLPWICDSSSWLSLRAPTRPSTLWFWRRSVMVFLLLNRNILPSPSLSRSQRPERRPGWNISGRSNCLKSSFLRTAVHICPMDLHPALRRFDLCESKLTVQAVRVSGCQYPAAQSLQVRMPHDALHQPAGKTSSTVIRNNENISQIREGREIRDNAGKADLLLSEVNAETNRVLDGSFHRFSRNSRSPVGICQEFMDHDGIDARRIGADFIIAL